jgi:hypothetical protein
MTLCWQSVVYHIWEMLKQQFLGDLACAALKNYGDVEQEKTSCLHFITFVCTGMHYILHLYAQNVTFILKCAVHF